MTVTVTVANSVPAGSLGAAFSSFSASGLFTLTGVEDTLTAHAGGTQAAALALSSTKNYHRISVCATAGDSVALPPATVGQAHFVRNDGVASAQVYGTTPDTIDGVATATGVALPAGVGRWFVCTTAAKWYTDDAATTTGSGANVLANAPAFTTGIGVGAAAAGAGGVAFPAVAVAVADPNTFDDYEEGTYDAFVTPQTSGSITLDGAHNVLAYTKIGNLVNVRGRLLVDSVSSPVGYMRITLPFTAAANDESSDQSLCSVLQNKTTNAQTYFAFIAAGTAYIQVYAWAYTGVSTTNCANYVQATTEFYISATYQV